MMLTTQSFNQYTRVSALPCTSRQWVRHTFRTDRQQPCTTCREPLLRHCHASLRVFSRVGSKAGTAQASQAHHTNFGLGSVNLSGGQLRLIRPDQPDSPTSKVLLFLPGTDGTGQAISPQLESLHAAGYEVYCLNIPPDNRCNWQELTHGTVTLVKRLLASLPPTSNIKQVTLFGESFGGVLALKVAASAPDIAEQVVVLNPATCFNSSLGGLSSIVSSTNLLALFPPPLYRAAQGTLLPLLVDGSRLTPQATALMRAMIDMLPADDVEEVFEGGGGVDTSIPAQVSTVFSPSPTAAAANFRAGLLRNIEITDNELSMIQTPVLLLASARDRMFPSLQEGARLHRLLPCSQRIILPDSGHAAMLEDGIDIAALIATSHQPQASSSIHTEMKSQSSSVTSNGGQAKSNTGDVVDSVTGTVLEAASEQTPISVMDQSAETSSTHEHSNGNGNGNGFHQTQQGGASNGRPAHSNYQGNHRSGSGSSNTSHSHHSANGKDRVPSTSELDSFEEWSQILAPWRDLVSPVLLGYEKLPSPSSPDYHRPMLFVGNHQRIGFYDTPLLVYELAIRGYRVRGLAHPGHWSGPVGPFFEKFGAVKASPIAAYKLLRDKQKVLLFPGGAKEVCKPRGADYQLSWKEEPDFVRLATKCGALIVPFASVGGDDAYEVVMDTSEVVSNPVLGPVVKKFFNTIDPQIKVEEAVFPITKLPGLGIPSPFPIPNLNRLYFKIEQPIDTVALNLDLKDTEAVAALYADVRSTVEKSIAELLELRTRDPGAQAWGRLTQTMSSWTGMTMNATPNLTKPDTAVNGKMKA